MQLSPSENIYAARSTIPEAGRGIFAKRQIKKGKTIEVCPVLVMHPDSVPLLRKTLLHDYYFLWGKKHETVAICLGFGSLYNHSYTPNATYQKHFDTHTIDFVALSDIRAGEEITVNYNFGNPKDTSTLWIKSIAPYKEES